MKISLKKISDIFNQRNFQKISTIVFKKSTRGFLLVLLVSIFVYGGYIWYTFVYHSQWDDQKKQEYVKSKEKGAIFNRARFDIIVSEMETRKNNYNNNIAGLPDIFKLKEKTISQ